MDHELETIEQFIEEAKIRLDGRNRLREANLQDNIDYPNETVLNQLDSTIKKNSALVKKLKVFTDNQKEQILNDIDRLNLTKFISEIAASIIEAKIKLSDIPAVIEVCTKLNKTYREFSKNLLDQYVKYFPTVKRKNNDSQHNPGCFVAAPQTSSSVFSSAGTQSAGQSSKIQGSLKNEGIQINLSKIRVDLRLFAELILSGIFQLKDGFPVLMNLLSYLMVHDKNSHQNANAILIFCKGCGDEFLGLAPATIKSLAEKYDKEIPTSGLITVKRQELLRIYFTDYYQNLVKHIHRLHSDLSNLIAKSKKSYKSKGELGRDLRELIEIKHSECQKFQNTLNQLAELLGQSASDLPDLELEEDTDNEADVSELNLDSNSSGSRQTNLWDDEGTRSFYEELVDLQSLFPYLVVKVTSDRGKVSGSCKDRSLDVSDCDVSTSKLDNKTFASSGTDSCESTPTKGADDSNDEPNKTISSSSSEESLNTGGSGQINPGQMSQVVANRVQPDQFYNKLASCVNRDMIDNAAIDFIRFFNTKFGRKKLVRTLFNVQRTRLDLLPFYARLTASLHRYIPSISNDLVAQLKQDFRNLFKKKDQINIESKVKNVRFIGELVKFSLYSKQEALICLRMLLSDFTHHHIEMTCNLLETCGRLLYKSPESNHLLKLLLEQMMRKKQLLSVDSKYVTMIENAYYFTNPPEVVRRLIEEPPVHTYVRYLLYECLNRPSIDFVLQKIKKLDWNDKSLAKFVINCMIEAYNLKFYNIRYLAALLATLNKDQPWIAIAVTDGVVEDILLMMEINDLHHNQRRIPMIRYFGELYNYRLTESSLVFKILYSLVTYGVYYPDLEQQNIGQIPLSQLDPPDNLFRIKLICDLLDTCGHYLDRGQDKKKLDCYLLIFQRYYWCKRHIYMMMPYCMSKAGDHYPSSIEYLFNDAIFNLRPSFKMATSYHQATQAVRDFVENLVDDQSSQ